MAGKGHEERLPPTRLSTGCGFRKETIAGMRRNGRDAPIGVGRRKTPNLSGSDPQSCRSFSAASRPRRAKTRPWITTHHSSDCRDDPSGLLSNWPRYRPDERSNQRLQARKKLLWSASRAGKLPALVRDGADGGTARRAQGVTPSRLAMDAEDSPRRGGEPIAQSGRSSVIAHPGLHYLCSPRVILTKASRLLRISPLCIGAARQNPRQLHPSRISLLTVSADALRQVASEAVEVVGISLSRRG